MSIQFSLAPALEGAVAAAAADWQANNKVARFWAKDASLWTSSGEENWLGWQTIVERQQAAQADFNALAADVKAGGFESAVLLGMGGSSLCPEVLSVTFGPQAGFPNLHIVDSTNPAQVLSVRRKVDLSKALIIVASKSGSTLEPNVLKQYFFDETAKSLNFKKPGKHFIAITDPGSKMEQVALRDGFRHIFYGDPKIGGRFSALSNFGIIAAVVAGIDSRRALAEAAAVVAQCKLPVAENPAVRLGLLLGTAANQGRDKITIFTSPEIYDLGAWMEQLIAESTGKLGKGITPVDGEQIQSPEFYSPDRIFAYIRLKGSKDTALDEKVQKIAAAGHPVITLEISSLYGIFGQFFLWEVATSVAGAVMGINPFNQPDVESAKIETRALTAAYEETGKLPVSTPFLEDAGIKLYATEAYASKIKGATLAETLRRHLSEIRANDYFAALAYLPMFPDYEAAVQILRYNVLKNKKIATCVGFGPRFLHSTGQDYKGGPNQGVFLQITSDHAEDAAIPDQKYSFGVVVDAQAAGDLAVLESRGRRALRVHLGADIAAGLKTLNEAVEAALA
jgi:glucose-6-phosphate isomerase/transaldolase/glucose-6-phosphate isomerase